MAENRDRSIHPDLRRAQDGSLELRDDVDLDPARRQFLRMWQDDAQRNAFMYRLSLEQSQLPVEVQRSIAGQPYSGYGGDAYDGYLEYRADIARQRSVDATNFTGADIERMSLEEFDKFFDSNGRARPGVNYEPGVRDVDVLSSGVDPFSRQELRNREP
jgi:hypothetical protein